MRFLIPIAPLQPLIKALPGSRLPFLSPSASPDGFAGSILAFLSPNIPLAPRSKAILGSRLPFLSPGVLHDGLPGSISPFLSPFDPADPLRKPFSGSKLCILIPQAFSGGACSGCRSGAGEVYTGAPPKTPAPLKPFGSACPSARSGCAVPCGTSRSPARVPSLPGSANPALCAPGKHCLRDGPRLRLRIASAEPGISSAIRRPRSESRVGLRDSFAQRRGLGWNPSIKGIRRPGAKAGLGLRDSFA